jgi:hypothetical protein
MNGYILTVKVAVCGSNTKENLKTRKTLMAEETKYDKQAKHLRYRFDRESVKKMGWEKIDRKEKDYWRGRVQQWNQDRSTLNTQYNPRPHRNSSHTER